MIDTGRKEYSFEEADLVQVVSSTLEAYRFHLRDQGFEFNFILPKNPIYVVIDKDAISQAVLNLLSNAAKFSDKHRFIGVEMGIKDKEVWITVEDRGVGIPEENFIQIFEKFYRGKRDANQKIHGSELGLTIVKHIIESHGGLVSVESSVGKSSRFTIKLPLE